MSADPTQANLAADRAVRRHEQQHLRRAGGHTQKVKFTGLAQNLDFAF